MSVDSASAPLIDDTLARRNAVLLAFAQAINGASASIVIASASLIGAMMLGDAKNLATLPVSVMVLGTAAATLPAGLLMRRFGRRPAFVGALLLSIASGLVAAFAVVQNQFWLLTLACGGLGFAGAFGQQYRFAAADTASPAFKAKAISWVMFGGVLAGIIGPQTVIWTKDLFAPFMFAGTYAALSCLALIALGFVSFLKIPRPAPASMTGEGRPLREIVSQPRFIVSVACAVTSYALMSLVMTATPLAMIGCGLSQSDAALGIQWHVLAMFGPSFYTGNLIARFGKERVVATGLALLAACSCVALMGVDLAHFWIALILLGLGWNFGFIGATAMVTETYRPEERNMVQAVNDFLVFGFVAMASFSSGQLLDSFGWNMVNIMVFPFVLLSLVLLVWLVRHEKAVQNN